MAQILKRNYHIISYGMLFYSLLGLVSTLTCEIPKSKDKMSNFSFAETEFKDIYFLVFVTFVVIVLRVGEFVAILGFNWLFDHFKNFNKP